jgi:hypothetical protein
MKLWGKLTRAVLLVCIAVSLAIAYGTPEARSEALTAAAIFAAVALLVIPAIVRLFSSFTGDEDVLADGLPYSATITALEPTRLRYNRHYPVVEFSLEVHAGGAPYPVQIKQAVDPQLLEQLAPGSVVDVRVDRSRRDKVVIDWQGLARQSGNPPGGSGGRFPAGRTNAKTVGTMLLVLTLFFAGFAYEAWRYETHGVTVQGTAIGASGKRDWAYSFIVDGRVVHGKSEVLWETASTLKPGGPVNVQYLSGAPETNRIPGQRGGYATWRAMAVAAFIAGIALLWRARRQRRAQMKP